MIGGKKFIILLKLRKSHVTVFEQVFSALKMLRGAVINHGSKYRPGFRRIYHSGVNIWENILVPAQNCRKIIRQIGERDEVVRLYVEDYVNTYLETGISIRRTGTPGRAAARKFGSTAGGSVPLCGRGAGDGGGCAVRGEDCLSEAAWKKAYQRMEETFPKKTVQGWFICGAPGCMLSPLTYWRLHKQYFGGKNQLMYINSGVDGEAAYYVMSEDGFYRLKGYHIYYEKNQMMQDYMILRKDARRVETGTGDRVIRDFRNRMEERQQEAASRYGTIRALGTLCGVLSVAVLAGGVVLFGNYQKMREMESVLVSVLPDGVRGTADGKEAVTVEQLRGSVTPLESGDVDADGQQRRTEDRRINGHLRARRMEIQRALP